MITLKGVVEYGGFAWWLSQYNKHSSGVVEDNEDNNQVGRSIWIQRRERPILLQPHYLALCYNFAKNIRSLTTVLLPTSTNRRRKLLLLLNLAVQLLVSLGRPDLMARSSFLFLMGLQVLRDELLEMNYSRLSLRM